MATTKIEWADRVWNPVTGCTKVSEGCRNCYAERMAKRLAGRCGYPPTPNQFKVTLHPERLELPLHWKKPARIFVDSMSDLFHEDVPDDFIWRVLNIASQAKMHTFQILTKRPKRMFNFFNFDFWKETQRPNVWLGVSVEDQKTADERIPWLLKTPAAVRFLSCEPLLNEIDLQDTGAIRIGQPYSGSTWRKIDWLICGGETGPGARPMHLSWARSLKDQCHADNVPFFFKQWGGGTKIDGVFGWDMLEGKQYHEFPEGKA